MQGKYSPTVNTAYARDQEWHDRLRGDEPVYDVDGYDSYGYDRNDRDRAGVHEFDYPAMDSEDFCCMCGDWDFDGVRPVKVK